MKIVDTMPQNGAFVMVWEWDNELHSDSFKYIDNVLYVWDIPNEDTYRSCWVKVELSNYRCVFEECNVKYIVK
ncbi:hypothetical protein ASswx1_41 [Aeromonas phage Asswx_1]|uniref:Uncharacterized protein n=1 Tax=Aeromonas phage Asswx_1 TaxID=2419739 RepID=A0A411B817_9CAUD|nr:hypothetical protein ASswx1_41 [Aeromonas phage Asswx_1]